MGAKGIESVGQVMKEMCIELREDRVPEGKGNWVV
jgi:hypothetical protein